MLQPVVFRAILASAALSVLIAGAPAAQEAHLQRIEAAAPSLVPENRAVGPVRVQSAAGRPAVAPEASADLLTPSRLADDAALSYGTGIRRTLLMGLTGAAAGAVAGGVMEIVDPHGEIADVWPVLLAIPGFFVGVVYSLVF